VFQLCNTQCKKHIGGYKLRILKLYKYRDDGEFQSALYRGWIFYFRYYLKNFDETLYWEGYTIHHMIMYVRYYAMKITFFKSLYLLRSSLFLYPEA
jgi:hypothetical protein